MITKAKDQMRRVAGLIPAEDARALEQSAQENGRTLAAELRMAVNAYLRANGRRAQR